MMTKTGQASRSFRRAALVAVLWTIAGRAPWAEAATTRYLTASGGDDTTAINSTINISAPGDTVYLNAGSFQITGPIQARTAVAIVGAGRASTTVRYTGGAGNPMVNLGGVSNVEVAHLTLDGNGNAAQGINAWSGSGQYIHDAGIQHLAANAIGIHFSSAVTDSRIVNNQFTDIGVGSQWGAGVRMAWGSSRNQVLDNTIANAGRGGIFGNDGSTDLVIQNNTVTGSGSGGTGLGIEVWNGCDRALIEDNTIDQWLSVDNSSRVAVRHNVVSGGLAGLEFATGGHDGVFADNTISNAFIGISVSGPTAVKERVLWTHNTIQGSTSWGAQIMSEHAGAAVRQMVFHENTFQGSAAAGFRFHPNYPVGSIENITLDGNTITQNSYGITGGDWGPGARLDKLTVVDNTITGNSLAAFSGSMGTPAGDAYFGNELRWEGNTVAGNGTNNQQTSKGTFFDNPPLVSIGAPAVAAQGQAVNFSFDYEGPQTVGSVLWDLGDGLPQTASNPSHVYDEAGVYRVGLVVWDAWGRAAHDEVLFTVRSDLPGDVDGDGIVDFGDLALLAPFFGQGPAMAWSNGDFNGDGWVNMVDLDLMALSFFTTYSTTGTQAVSGADLFAEVRRIVPEPSVAAVLMAMALRLAARRPRTSLVHNTEAVAVNHRAGRENLGG